MLSGARPRLWFPSALFAGGRILGGAFHGGCWTQAAGVFALGLFGIDDGRADRGGEAGDQGALVGAARRSAGARNGVSFGDHVRDTETQKGDWRPLVFLLTDGCPTDLEDFEQAAAEIKSLKIGNIIACAAGADADTSYLKKLTDNVLMMNSLSAGDMAKFFAWVSGSIKMSSKSLDAKPGAAIELPPPPKGFTVVP